MQVSKMSVSVVLCMVVALAGARPEAPSSQYGPPSSGYGAPSGGGYPSGRPGGGHSGGGGGGGGGDDLAEDPNYNFMYEVKDAASGNDFGHQESNMNNVVKGSYHVLLPDGRMQKVDYMADWQSGYNPTVTYTGEAKYGPGVGGGKATGGGGPAGGGATGGGPAGGGAAGGGYVYRR